jgi:DNA-binding NtrC family response regulator
VHPQSRLLIVDRDPTARESLGKLLAESGFEVSAVASADEALLAIAASRPDAALLALDTPEDLELQQRLQDEYPQLVLIAMMNANPSGPANLALADGVYDYLTKPLDPMLMPRRLRNAVAHRSAEKEILQVREELARVGHARSLYDVERLHILRILEECGNNQSRAAEILGIDRVTLHHKLKRYGWSRVRAIS